MITTKGIPLSTNNVQHQTATEPRTVPTDMLTAIPATGPAAVAAWCADTFARFVAWMQDRTDRELNGAQALALAAAVLAGVGSTLVFGGWLAYQLVRLLVWLVGGHAGADLVHALPVLHVAVDSIVAWADQHAAGLPVAPAALLTAWGVGGAVLAVAGLAGSRGARIAWPLYGAATAAMAWFGATEPHRPIAAGLIALVWGVASIAVLHRGGARTAVTHITNVLPARDRESVPTKADRPADAAPLAPVD